jgi:Arc/MetJ-type ribon-helix-helix transcriptional regulator
VARAPNSVQTSKLQLSTTPQVLKALDVLVKTGKFGKTASEVGEELLRLKLREVELEGWLDPGPPKRRS